jgi:hypothetical protein
MRAWLCLCELLVLAPLALAPARSYASGDVVEGFRAGVRVPFATGDQRALTPAVGVGAEVRLDRGSREHPFGVGLVCAYDQFVLSFPDEEVGLSDGTVLRIPRSQSVTYTRFIGQGTVRLPMGPLSLHAEGGAGVVIGFFQSPEQGAQPELFFKAAMPAVSGGAGLALAIGEQGVVDLGLRYERLFGNTESVRRNDTDVRIFNDTVSLGLSAGYLF